MLGTGVKRNYASAGLDGIDLTESGRSYWRIPGAGGVLR